MALTLKKAREIIQTTGARNLLAQRIVVYEEIIANKKWSDETRNKFRQKLAAAERLLSYLEEEGQ